MKKVKLMLLSLSVLAVVGGALAFKAKQDFRFCTAPTVLNQACDATNCPTDSHLKAQGAVDFICTTPTTGVASRPCQDANQVDILCTTTSVKLIND